MNILELLTEYAELSDYDDSDYTTQFKVELAKFLKWAKRQEKS